MKGLKLDSFSSEEQSPQKPDRGAGAEGRKEGEEKAHGYSCKDPGYCWAQEKGLECISVCLQKIMRISPPTDALSVELTLI